MSSALRKSNMIMTIRLTVIDIFYDRFWRLLSKSFYLAQARIKLLHFFHGISWHTVSIESYFILR